MAERLRRWTANPMCSARVGSNPILVVKFLIHIHPIPQLRFAIPKTEKGLIRGKQPLDEERESQIRTHAQYCLLPGLGSGGLIPKHLRSPRLGFNST